MRTLKKRLLTGLNLASACGLPGGPSSPLRYGELPLSFEENRGQSPAAVRFQARGQGHTLFLTEHEMVLTPREGGALRIRLAGGTLGNLAACEPLPGRVHYFRGRTQITNVPTCARVKARDVYPGVDLECYGKYRETEYDLVVHPGARPESIRLAYAGCRQLELDDDGNLIVDLGPSRVTQPPPTVRRPAAADGPQRQRRALPLRMRMDCQARLG